MVAYALQAYIIVGISFLSRTLEKICLQDIFTCFTTNSFMSISHNLVWQPQIASRQDRVAGDERDTVLVFRVRLILPIFGQCCCPTEMQANVLVSPLCQHMQ